MFGIKTKSACLLTAMMFLGANHIIAMEPKSDLNPDFKIDWNSRFDLLDKQLNGDLTRALKHFEVNYLGEKLIAQIDFLKDKENEDAITRQMDFWFMEHSQSKIPLFVSIFDLSPEMIESILLDADIISNLKAAAKIYLCQKLEPMIEQWGSGDVDLFLCEFSGNFYLKLLAGLVDCPKQAHEIKVADAANFCMLMCELFDQKCVRDAVMSKIPAEILAKLPFAIVVPSCNNSWLDKNLDLISEQTTGSDQGAPHFRHLSF
jgi:hypothetical protein